MTRQTITLRGSKAEHVRKHKEAVEERYGHALTWPEYTAVLVRQHPVDAVE